ncbi:hypothetical protein [Tengunoibacter tsumagoiensis]|uniref:Uncharacterized protein n=1 Tax=Tengunoibacter tsumagoiensis TaxID=2014871 RepID=A0A402A2W8_9CHLR|nr:hypothetical protein [Tengunoibacter tsumagoiensis]GCE13474.1 hypothetical protein KTT_33330 [Tengunoibacter tsumagoiensis]
MAKLHDLFTQARRTQNSGGMGFLGKNKAESKARSAALVVEFTTISAGQAEAAIKAGADGLLFHWNPQNESELTTLKAEIASAQASNDQLVTGLALTGNLEELERATLVQIKEAGIQYIVLPFDAPARLLAVETKELEKVVIVPMRDGEIYPLYIHNLTAFDGIAAVLLDFGLISKVSSMTIEEVLDYRAVREAVRFPAFLPINANLTEEDAYTLATLGAQAVVLKAEKLEKTVEQIKAVRDLLIKIHEDEKEKDTPSVPGLNRK